MNFALVRGHCIHFYTPSLRGESQPVSPSSLLLSTMSDSILAVFGDVHANFEALQAVLADMNAQAISHRVCLGDIVGYAASPVQCLESVIGLGCPVVQGNHDEAAAEDFALDDMGGMAQRGVEFARRKLSRAQRAYLARLPLTLSNGNCQFVHASLSAPGDWQYTDHEEEVHEHFQAQTMPLCFCGHTHKPTLWHLDDSGDITSWHGQGCFQLPKGGKMLVDVGSVGQPRDINPDACYVIYDPQGHWVEFRRVAYDIDRTRQKIVRAKLPKHAAERLSLGR